MGQEEKKIKQIKVVSNTHWDREFRRSFEKTRHALLTMMDTTLDILESDPKYHSFTMDGHSIMIDDYLEMRPERTEQVKRFIREGRLIIGPYYTLAEQFSISGEALVRNLIFGRKTVEKYGGKTGTVAYTPSSWGQTGQYPQILSQFGIDKMMFYRGISHHEADAEYIWEAPDGTWVYASRFAIYARYNWYYQVHRKVSRDRDFSKDYIWGEFDETPFRMAGGDVDGGLSYDLKNPVANYMKENLKDAILSMVEREGGHFTTPVFLGMNGHDISVAFPRESEVIEDAKKLFEGQFEIEHTDLEGFWNEALKYLDKDKMTHLRGERRSYLKEGMWTFLFPGTVSARTYLKQKDSDASHRLSYYAEPLDAVAGWCGKEPNKVYLDRGWNYLLSNHTHDANGGCAPDEVCKDMEYRYRKAADVADIVAEDAMVYIAKNLSPEGQPKDALSLIVYNSLPFKRDAVVKLSLEIPRSFGGKAVVLESENDGAGTYQPIANEKSSVFVDSIWEVPTILDSVHHELYAKLTDLPAMGYRVYTLKPAPDALQKVGGIVKGDNLLENENLCVKVNPNGTIDLLDKRNGKEYKGLNYLTSEGEAGNAWKHAAPAFDQKFNSLGVNAQIAVVEDGPLSATIEAAYDFTVPASCDDCAHRTGRVAIPVVVSYTLTQGSDFVDVRVKLQNHAKDHWLRANFPTGIVAEDSYADSHFDIVKRPVAVPDSTGWVEQAFGTQPLQTFATLSDGEAGFAVMPKGLFEYEITHDSVMTLTLIRACRIKLAVSEEKLTELDDEGVQCPGQQVFQYALHVYDGKNIPALLNKAAAYRTEVKCAAAGRGKGTLAHEMSALNLDNPSLHLSAVKPAEDGEGTIIRIFNPTEEAQKMTLTFGAGVTKAQRAQMDESTAEALTVQNGQLQDTILPKKIMTYRVS